MRAAPFFRRLRGDLHPAHAPGLAPSPDRCWLRAGLLVPIDTVAPRGAYRPAADHFDQLCRAMRDDATVRVRVQVRVRPGTARTKVGGSFGDALVVAVTAPAVDGRATEAALRAVAEALGVRRADVALVAGATSRSKVIEVRCDDEGALRDRISALRLSS